jgi:hypothetical protein
MAEAGMVCPKPMQATSHGAFQGDNPLDYSLPLAILQICLVVVVTRGLAYLLRPLRQPRVIAEIIVSLLLSLYLSSSYYFAGCPVIIKFAEWPAGSPIEWPE